MNLLRRLLSWITIPTLLHGVVIGVFLALLTALTWQLALARYVAVALLVAGFLLCTGALLGSLTLQRSLSKETDEVGEPMTRTLARVISDLGTTDESIRRSALRKSLTELAANSDQLIKSGCSAALRFLYRSTFCARRGNR